MSQRFRAALGGRHRLVALATIVAVVALGGGTAASDAAAAYPCTPTATVDDSGTALQYQYSLCDVPDLDQRRTLLADDPFFGTILGLPGNGSMWCVPTSTMNWLAYIAAHGFPDLDPGIADWENPNDFATYNLMTERLETLGALMGTDAEDGTGRTAAVQGLKLWLAGQGLSDEFGILAMGDFSWYSPTVNDISGFAVSGALVSVAIGRYKDLRAEAPAGVKHLFPSGLTRVGGHMVSLVGLDTSGGKDPGRDGGGSISFHDPARGEADTGFAPILQSAFTREEYHVAMEWGGFADGHGPFLPHLTDYSESNPNQFIDGYLAIVPKVALSATATQLIVANPLAPLITSGIPAERRWSPPGGGRVIDLEANPTSTRHPYLLADDNTIWELDALTGKSSRFATVGNPRELVFGGREQKLYVLLENHVISLDPLGRERDRILLPEPVDEIAYDRANERVVGLSASGDRVFSWDTKLQPQTVDSVPALPCGGRAELVVDPSDGSLLLHCPGTGEVLRKSASGKPPPVTFELRGAPNARGLAIDESGRLLAVDDGLIAVFDADGTRLTDSVFAGKPAGDHLALTQSFSNLDPAALTGPGYHNVLPDDPDPPIEIPPRR